MSRAYLSNVKSKFNPHNPKDDTVRCQFDDLCPHIRCKIGVCRRHEPENLSPILDRRGKPINNAEDHE